MTGAARRAGLPKIGVPALLTPGTRQVFAGYLRPVE
jgi:hypothetical protein